jgi:hypothetical protein
MTGLDPIAIPSTENQATTMHMIRRPRSRAPVVTTRKTPSAVPVGAPFSRDLVLQSVLDPAVRRVEFLSQVVHDGSAVPIRSIVVTRDDKRFLVDLTGSSPARSAHEQRTVDRGLEALGIERIEMPPHAIRREPRFSNARMVWQHLGTPVSRRDRHRITTYLAQHGPTRIGLLEVEVDTSIDMITAVCALACDDVLEIDIDAAPLGRRTRVAVQR